MPKRPSPSARHDHTAHDQRPDRPEAAEAAQDSTDLAEERVARELEDDIIFGRIGPGEQLREEKLLHRFGHSRHVIRRALTRLENLGIVVKERNHSAVVRTFTPQEVIEIHDVREILQRQAALRIPLPATDEQIDRITRIEEDYEHHLEIGDLRGIHLANERFHDALFSLCGNRHLQDLIGKMLALTYAVRSRSLADPEDRAKARAEHRLMIGLLSGRDHWALAEVCVEHIRSRRDAYLDFLAGRSQGQRKPRNNMPAQPAVRARSSASNPESILRGSMEPRNPSGNLDVEKTCRTSPRHRRR
jgi:DNA-binding GntR family transcriptional regulator